MEYAEMDKSSYDSVRTEGGCAADSSAGSLVWVRRRNGHWWPGRVMAADEVPRSEALPSKSGTPVKLLGKDDATVDWYNFGKSRRIKAFRCGEFDDCIERARSFGCLRSKNREKYARRDDAILHALELERRQADGMQSSATSLSAAAILGPPVLTKQVASKSVLKSGYLSSGHTAHFKPRRCALGPARQLSNASDVSTRLRPSANFDLGIPRMRGLQDFGLQVVRSKSIKSRCLNTPEVCLVQDGIETLNEGDGSCNNLPNASLMENGNKMESCITGLTTAGVCSTPSDSKTSLSAVQKRKKHPTGSSADESSHKKRDRRRPLTQVLKKSSSKAMVLGGESSVLPSSTTDCLTCLCRRDGTEASSSQDAFQLVVNECRSNPEQRDLDLQPTGIHGGYELKHEQNRPLPNLDTAVNSLWSRHWDSFRWSSLVNADMDLSMLLGPPYGNANCKRRNCVPNFPVIAYTGSADSVNTPNNNEPGALKYLRDNSDFSDPAGKEALHSKGFDCAGMNDHDHVALQSMSKWQAKKRRNTRKSPCFMGKELNKGGNSSGVDGLYKDQDHHLQMAKTRVLPISRPRKERRLNLLVCKNDIQDNSPKREDKNLKSKSLCFNSRKSNLGWGHDSKRQSLQWINVRVDFTAENRNKSGELVSLFSEAMNSPIVGYPVLVQISRSNRAGVNSLWQNNKPDIAKHRTGSGAPQHPRHKSLDQSPERGSLQKVRSKSRGRKPTGRLGSSMQKTRMLSSLTSTEFIAGKEHHMVHGSFDANHPEPLKAPIVTCIPVHLVYERIREALYRRPLQPLKESCEETAPNGDL